MDETRQLSDRSTLVPRVLYTVVFAIALWIVGWVLALTVVIQLVLRLVNGNPLPDLTRFGAALATYTRQIIEYVTFATDTAPFPFSDWPNAPKSISRDDVSGL
jgi:hypothetical protein